MIKKMSKLGLKIVIPTLFSVLCAIALIVTVILSNYNKEYSSLSSEYINTMTNNYAKQIESKMALTLNTAEAESLSIKSIMERPDATREEVLGLVRTILENHEELLGIGVGFEPNAFDGRDIEYTVGTNHSDENGRFVPYTYRENGIIDYTLLDGYDDPGEYGSWYNVPKRTNQTYVTNPYWYEVGTEKYLMFTCVAPLRDKNGQFIGMTGFDTSVSLLNSIVENAKVFDTGYLTLIAPDSTIAYHPDTAVMGTDAKTFFHKNVVDAINDAYSTGTAKDLDISPADNNQKVRYTIVPIEVGLSGGKWIVLTSVPLSEINKVVNDTARAGVVASILIAIAILVILSLILTFTILRPVKIIKNATDDMSKGSLDIHIPIKSKDEFGQLAANVEMASQKMLYYVSNISKTLGEISNGNMIVDIDNNYIGDFLPIQTSMEKITAYLNETLRKISSSAEQVSDESKQLSNKTQDLAQSSSDAADLSGTIRTNAEKSSVYMAQMMKAVKEISEAGNAIAKVVKVVDEIASQTNILALNATVEAARVGEAGKSFSVVAEEVRNLAEKSLKSANNIEDLIRNSMEKTALGLNISIETSESLKIIVDEIRRNDEIISNIAESAMQGVTSANEMSSQSLIMRDLVSQFKL